jgi:hypothetical protein
LGIGHIFGEDSREHGSPDHRFAPGSFVGQAILAAAGLALKFGLSCGRQSCLQAAFQAAFSICGEFFEFRYSMPRETKPEE